MLRSSPGLAQPLSCLHTHNLLLFRSSCVVLLAARSPPASDTALERSCSRARSLSRGTELHSLAAKPASLQGARTAITNYSQKKADTHALGLLLDLWALVR